MGHTYLHQDATDMMKKFRYDAHPMGMIISTISALSTFRP
jgi:citrate synthase